LKVLFYGRLAELAGPELEVEAPQPCSIAELREAVISQHPDAEAPLRSKRALACVGDALVPEDYLIRPGDAVEFLPPVSGG
jgi:molybdopterin converting factor small subunit